MNGGLIEGLKMCFKGRHVRNSHLGILILLIGIVLPFVDVKLNTHLAKIKIMDVFNYNQLYGILVLICMAGLLLYFIKFMHNTIQLNIYQDFQNDPEKVKSWTVMPKFDKTLFSNWTNTLIFFLVWTLYSAIIAIPLIVLGFIPFVNTLVIIGFSIMALYTSTYIVMGFAAQYKTEGNLDISLLFKYFPKVFVPHTVLLLKSIPLSVLITLISFLAAKIIVPLVLGALGLFVTVSVITLLYAYLYTLFTLAFYYAAAFIYYNQIFLTKDE